METADGDGRWRRRETARDVIDGFWETVLERIGNSRTIVAKGYDTQVSKLFKFFNLGVSAKTNQLLSPILLIPWLLVKNPL